MWYKFAKSLDERYRHKIFHGGLRDHYEDISKYGIIPQIGQFVEEAYGPEYDEEEFKNENNDASYWATWEELAKAFGAMEHHIQRKLNLPHGTTITPEHIQQHGLLAVTQPDRDFYQMPRGGIDTPKQYNEEKQDFSGGHFYKYDDYGGGSDQYPFGVEPGDVFTQEFVGPDKIYIGKKLRALYNKFKQHNPDFKSRQEMIARINARINGDTKPDKQYNYTPKDRTKPKAPKYQQYSFDFLNED